MRKPAWQVRIARERISILFELARKEFDSHPKRSRRYVELARRIGLRYNVRLPKELRRSFCRTCNTLLIPGKSCQIRIARKVKSIRCMSCNRIYRYPL
jgi:ribonuclease P protein subunit RPR2